MTLLREVMDHPLDPGYAEAAAEKAHGTRRRTWSGRAVTAVIALALGIAIVMAVAALRAPEPKEAKALDNLRTQAQQRQNQAKALASENATLAAEVGGLVGRGQSAQGSGADALALAAGTTAVQGPGLVITITQSQQAGGTSADLVQADDLEVVANGLWQAGAEAVGINGVRLTATSAISEAGQSIQVDLQPVVSPFRISAIGDAEAMETGLARTDGGTRLAVLRNDVGASVDEATSSRIDLPGSGAAAALYYASAPPTATATPTAPASGTAKPKHKTKSKATATPTRNAASATPSRTAAELGRTGAGGGKETTP
ncbi:MAG: DUF881 domain-containing protein [Bifidobacteriaceae bacterium]|jgi:uncharacterized protein YlxW (UPF0749 family)|nr:DUF881 domain-containing protein [Bifidobacteriaceae bacterium]